MDQQIDEVLGDLRGHTVDQGQLTWLTSGIGDDDLTLSVEDASRLFRGVAEVGEELVYIASVDANAGTATLAPFGRGYLNTEASSWSSQTRIAYAPRFPRARVREVINNTIRTSWPTLFAVGTTEIENPSGAKITFDLPSEAEDVLNVKQKMLGPTGFWRTLTRYSVRQEDGGANEINLMAYWDTGSPIRITYSTKPVALETGDEFTDSGLSETAWEAIKFGAMFRLITVQEAGRSGAESVQAKESQRRSGKRAPTDLASQYYAIHQQFLNEERSRLFEEHEVVSNEVYL